MNYCGVIAISSQGTTWNVLDFAALYGDYLLAKRHRNQWAGQFTTDGMEQLMAQTPGERTCAR